MSKKFLEFPVCIGYFGHWVSIWVYDSLMQDSYFFGLYLNNTIRSCWFPPRQLKAVCLDRENLDIPWTWWSSLIRHDHHNRIWSVPLGVDHPDADQVLRVHGQVLDGVARGRRVGNLDLLALSRGCVSWSMSDHVTKELTMDGAGNRSTPLKIDGAGAGVVSCQDCRFAARL